LGVFRFVFLAFKQSMVAQVLKRGYWGDISTGPYIAFGTQSEDPEMLAKLNARHTKVLC
jgi:hypothetical protein